MRELIAPRHRAALLCLGCGLLLAAALYWPGLTGPFIYDDAFNLAPLFEWHRDLMPWQDVVLGNPSGPLGRPVSMLSFIASGMFGVDPFHFKLGNLLLHLLTSVLAWLVIRRVMQLDARLAPRASLLATCATLLWLLHPLHASTVLYSIQRMAQLGALFPLAVLLAYLHARRLLESGDRRRGLLALFLTAPLLCLLGLLSKENAAVAPLLCLLLELLYPSRSARAKGPLRAFLAGAAIVPVIAGCVVLVVAPERLLGGYASRDFTAYERLLTQSRALCDYLGQIFWPQLYRMGVYTDGYAVSHGWLDPPSTLLSALLLGALTGAAWWLRKRAPIISFGWGFFLIAHAVESSLLPLDLYYEHRNYLPMVGLAAGVVGGAAQLRTGPAPAFSAATGLVAAMLLCVGLTDRVHGWQSREQLLSEALAAHPQSMRAQLAQVDADTAAGRFAEAHRRLIALEAQAGGRQRLIVRIEALSLRCRAGESVSSRDIMDAMAEPPDRIATDDIQSVNLLLQHSRPGACGTFDDYALGTALGRLAERMEERGAPKDLHAELSFAGALAFARSGHVPEAAAQALRAWENGGRHEAGFLLVWSQAHLGRIADGERTLAQMERQRPNFSRAADREIYKARVVLRQAGAPPP